MATATATRTNDFVFDFLWHDPETGLNWLYGRSCWSYEVYFDYPNVVKYNGLRYMKMGWNSDTGSIAYRQTTASDVVATPV